MCFFFFKQKTAYEMRISDWSSDVCSSDLHEPFGQLLGQLGDGELLQVAQNREDGPQDLSHPRRRQSRRVQLHRSVLQRETAPLDDRLHQSDPVRAADAISLGWCLPNRQQSNVPGRSEEHTSELQSLMRI